MASVSRSRRRWGALSEARPLNGNGKNGGFYDPAFSDNRSQPVHRWVPWIAGYSCRFVDDVLDNYAGGKRVRVLDPFAGVGTTLVQARLRGCDVVGFELNPWAGFVAQTKLLAWANDMDPDAIENAVDAYRRFVKDRRNKVPGRKPPSGFRTRIPFFGPAVERKVLLALDFIDLIEKDDHYVTDIFRVALGALLVSFSNYTYEPSLGSRPGAGKPLVQNADVAGALSAKILQMADDIRWVRKRMVPKTEGTVYVSDFFDYEKHNLDRFHLAITSPPYLNNYHYVRNTRPQLFWLGMVDERKDLQQFEDRNIGKFWQTVRDGKPVDLLFWHKDLEQTLNRLRETRKNKGPYGGPGWANYVATYFNDSYRFLGVLADALHGGGVAVVMIGNSIIQGIEIPVDRFLAELASERGFESKIETLREKRVGESIVNSSVRRGERPGGVGLYESALILRADV